MHVTLSALYNGFVWSYSHTKPVIGYSGLSFTELWHHMAMAVCLCGALHTQTYTSPFRYIGPGNLAHWEKRPHLYLKWICLFALSLFCHVFDPVLTTVVHIESRQQCLSNATLFHYFLQAGVLYISYSWCI